MRLRKTDVPVISAPDGSEPGSSGRDIPRNRLIICTLIGLVYLAYLSQYLAEFHATYWPFYAGYWPFTSSRPLRLGEAPLNGARQFDWDALIPETHLHYRCCYGHFNCAKLQVPLRWQNESSTEKISIAVVRLPATIPVDDPRHGGSIIVNPGGPGGSGVDFVRYEGESLANIVSSPGKDDENEKFFDIISFDPRGVERSDRHTSCFANTETRFLHFLRTAIVLAAAGSPEMIFSNMWSLLKSGKGTCATNNADDLRRHVTTAAVARDMLELTEQDWLWRQRLRLDDQHFEEKERAARLEDGRKAAKLQYWGFSYGTLVGETFAAMFPDRVGRMVLDGVIEMENYYQTKWTRDLYDTDKVLDHFYKTCADVGSKKCPLAENNATMADVSHKVNALLDRMRDAPISIPSAPGELPESLTYSTLVEAILDCMYAPSESFPQLGSFLALLIDSDKKLLQSIGESLREFHNYDCKSPNKPLNELLDLFETSNTIVCTDGIDITNSTLPDFISSHLDPLRKQSPLFGAIWARSTLPCVALAPSLRPEWRFEGPYDVQRRTSHPVLLIANSADPVTPIVGAKRMEELFEGSTVLEQKSFGHCSISSFSRCTVAAIREYFSDRGGLPDHGTKCEVDVDPWDGKLRVQGGADARTYADSMYVSRISKELNNMKVGHGRNLGLGKYAKATGHQLVRKR